MCSSVTMFGPDAMAVKAKMNVEIKKTSDGVSYEWQSYDDFVPDLAEIKRVRPHLYKRTAECGGSFNAAQHWW